jgi:predicted NBD/HSP70 family sugar kinase
MYGAVDIGGTKTLVGVFDENGSLVKQVRFKTPTLYSDFKEELSKNTKALGEIKYKVTTMALPGKVDRAKGLGLAFSNLAWENVTARDDAEKIFNCPVLIENDSKLAALSEAVELKEYKKVLYITISTGINGGFIVNGKIDKSIEDSEMGQMLFEHDGELKQWQSFASGHALVLT